MYISNDITVFLSYFWTVNKSILIIQEWVCTKMVHKNGSINRQCERTYVSILILFALSWVYLYLQRLWKNHISTYQRNSAIHQWGLQTNLCHQFSFSHSIIRFLPAFATVNELKIVDSRFVKNHWRFEYIQFSLGIYGDLICWILNFLVKYRVIFFTGTPLKF